MKRFVFVFAFALSQSFIFAQHSLEISLNGGAGTSQIFTDMEEEISTQSSIENQYLSTFSLEALYSYQLKNWSVESGVGLSFIQGITRESFLVYSISNPFEYWEESIEEHRKATYVQIPVRFGYHLNNLAIAAGVYSALHITDASEMTFYRNGVPNGFQMGGNRLSDIDFGLSSRIHYQVSKRFGVQFTANYGLMDVSNGNQLGAKHILYQTPPTQKRELKNRQFMIGVSYSFF